MSDAARWPTAVDYQTALQAPSLCFNDPALKRATVAMGPLGLPLAATGNVVAVFRVQTDGQDLAVRCFTRQSRFESLERRYKAIGTLLDRVRIPALVDCSYLPNEILAGGERYAIVHMEWVQGIHLHRFIEQHLAQRDRLLALADQWRSLMAQLRATRVAHGDLSDGNILVDEQGRLRLVDYDSMYLSSLKEHPPAELGKPHYQHPERLKAGGDYYGYYAEDVDAFSALVIYLSIRALADDPERWDRFHVGENLLFQQADYGVPGQTPLWTDLRDSRDAEVRALTDALHRCCHTPPDELPDLEEVLLRIHMRPPLEVKVPVAMIGGLARTTDHSLPPLEEPDRAPALRPRSRIWQRALHVLSGRRGAAGGGMLLLTVLVLVGFWFSGSRLLQAFSSSALPSPDVLHGTFDGYLFMPNGSTAPLTLIIEDVQPASQDAAFAFTLLWSGGTNQGRGTYRSSTGRVDLEGSYALFLKRSEDGDLVLASANEEGRSPLVELRRTLDVIHP